MGIRGVWAVRGFHSVVHSVYRESCSFGLPRVPFVNCCQFMYLIISLLVFEGRMWGLTVSVPDHCLSFYFSYHVIFIVKSWGTQKCISYGHTGCMNRESVSFGCSFGLPWELFIRFTASAFHKLPSIYVFGYFSFGFEGRVWGLTVSVPDHCLSFYFSYHFIFIVKSWGTQKCISYRHAGSTWRCGAQCQTFKTDTV